MGWWGTRSYDNDSTANVRDSQYIDGENTFEVVLDKIAADIDDHDEENYTIEYLEVGFLGNLVIALANKCAMPVRILARGLDIATRMATRGSTHTGAPVTFKDPQERHDSLQAEIRMIKQAKS